VRPRVALIQTQENIKFCVLWESARRSVYVISWRKAVNVTPYQRNSSPRVCNLLAALEQKIRRRSVNRCYTMADNTGHGFLSIEKRKVPHELRQVPSFRCGRFGEVGGRTNSTIKPRLFLLNVTIYLLKFWFHIFIQKKRIRKLVDRTAWRTDLFNLHLNYFLNTICETDQNCVPFLSPESFNCNFWRIYVFRTQYVGRFMIYLFTKFRVFSSKCYLNITIKTKQNKTKQKFRPRTGYKSSDGEQKYSSTLSLPSTLDGCGWLKPRFSTFTPKVQKVFEELIC
jgi:hypothetical protein